MEHGARSTEHGTRNTEHGTRSTEHEARSMEHGTRSTEHRKSTEERQHGLTCTEGMNACQSQVEEELLSFCKYYTMAVEKKEKDSIQS